MAQVAFQNVWKRYGTTPVVQDLNLEIADGEFVVLVGPSGSGKSTAMRMLAGLEEISDGQIVIGDRVVNHLAPKERDVAMVFQSYALYPHMSVFDNMAYALKLRRVPRDEIRRRVEDASRILDIGQLLDRKPKQLSGGQRQRVALGRAIVREPQVFLMDEPLSNLDAKLRVQTRAEIIKLHQRIGATTIYVTHDQVEAMTMGDRIAVLNFGQLQQFDTPENLYKNPVNRFVAGFIGSPSMNFFMTRIEEHDGHIRLTNEAFSLAVSPAGEVALRQYGKREVLTGVRPEHVIDRRLDGQLPREAVINATVDVVEMLGSEQFVYLDAGLGDSFVARMPPDLELRQGGSLEVVLPPERLHFFDPESGDAITREVSRPSTVVPQAV